MNGRGDLERAIAQIVLTFTSFLHARTRASFIGQR